MSSADDSTVNLNSQDMQSDFLEEPATPNCSTLDNSMSPVIPLTKDDGKEPSMDFPSHSSIMSVKIPHPTPALPCPRPILQNKVIVKKEGSVTEIEGVYIADTDRNKLLNLDSPHPKICPLCPEKLKMDVKYTDVMILSQFIRPDGCLLPRRATGLCAKAQSQLAKLVHRAQRAGLMPEYRPDLPDGRPHYGIHSPYKWRRYNAFFED